VTSSTAIGERIHISPRTGLLAVARHNLGWMIVGSDLQLLRPRESETGWWIYAQTFGAWNWLRERDLNDTRFAGRQDALRALTALHQQDPLPAVALPACPNLLRSGDDEDVWLSDCGHYKITRAGGAYLIDNASTPKRILSRRVPTLRMARRVIAEREAEIAQEAFSRA